MRRAGDRHPAVAMHQVAAWDRRDFDRRARIARWFCAIAGVTDRRHRARVMRQVTRWNRRAQLAAAVELGYLEIGGEG